MDEQSPPQPDLLVLPLTVAPPRALGSILLLAAVALGVPSAPLGPPALRAQQPPAVSHDGAPPAAIEADSEAQRRELASRLERILEDPVLARAHVGLSVIEIESGEPLYERAAERRFTAASTVKLVTGAVALHRLGAGHRWSTRFLLDGPLRDGVLEGDLWIVGGGDPSVDRETLAVWASALRRAGLRRIDGDVVGDDRAIPEPRWGLGWTWNDLYAGWGAGVSGLQLTPGRVRAELVPAAEMGDPARLRYLGQDGPVPLAVRVQTGPAGADPVLRWVPDPEGGPVGLEGWIPADRRVPLSLAPPHPTRYLLDRFALVLVDSGIAVEGRVRRAAEEEVPPASPLWTGEFDSDSLGLVLGRMLRVSDNQAAELLLRSLGREAGGRGTSEEGLAAVEETLAGWGIEPGAVALADGSGLSRYSEVTPSALVRLLRRVRQLPEGPFLVSSLPVGAVDGTLAGRFIGTVGQRNVRAKTGTLSAVRGLAGYVDDHTGEPLAFALLLNGFDAPDPVIRALEELVVEQLALFRGPGYPPPEPEPARPPPEP